MRRIQHRCDFDKFLLGGDLKSKSTVFDKKGEVSKSKSTVFDKKGEVSKNKLTSKSK